MPSVKTPQFDNLDRFADSLNKKNSAYGKEGGVFETPTDDASDLYGVTPAGMTKPGHFDATNSRASVPTPLTPMSVASTVSDAPPLGAFLESSLHDDSGAGHSDPTRPAFLSGKEPRTPSGTNRRPYRPGA